ncbi:MAG: type II toxin-antitoxin system RelE/ParE family toxin [Nitrospira sp.]|nr:type II toxin-antitoxin system RelE/ParE family toxin [Nitrospira sp.]
MLAHGLRDHVLQRGCTADILALPDMLAARYIVLTRRMIVLGLNLGTSHTKALGHGLFELRLKGAEGIARVFFCTLEVSRSLCCTASSKSPRRRLSGVVKSLKCE